jgi:hypothetical protein
MAMCRKCKYGIMPQMQPWHRAANATRATCRKCNQRPGSHASFHITDYRQAMRPTAPPRCWRRRGAGAAYGDGEGLVRPTATARGWRGLRRRRGVGAAYGDGEGLARPTATARGWRGLRRRRGVGAAHGDGEGLARPTATARGWRGLRRRRGAGAMFPNRRHTSRAKENATKFQKYLLRTQ